MIVDLLLICVRGGLALVFIAAAVGKLLDAEGSRRALREFGVRDAWIAPSARLLPIAELAVAAGLLVAPLARPAAAGALALLAAFAAGVAQALRRGQAPDCHCFGQLHSAPAGRGTIARNALLALPAAFVLWRGSGDALAGRGVATGALVATAALAAALAVATFVLLRENRRLRSGAPPAGPEPLAVGTPAPEVLLREPDGAMSGISSLIARDRSTALVFVAPGCGPCEYLMPHLARWRVALAERVEILVVGVMPVAGEPSASEIAQFPGALWDVEAKAFEAYRVDGTPAAVLVGPDGAIASSAVSGYETIEALIRTAQRRASPTRPPVPA